MKSIYKKYVFLIYIHIYHIIYVIYYIYIYISYFLSFGKVLQLHLVIIINIIKILK